MSGENTMALPEIQVGERGFLQPKDMRLDFENPRFAAYGPLPADDTEGIGLLLDHADLRELIETIAANGFINFEPLIVQRLPDHYLVLEGNRRLAAVKLLLDRDLAEELRQSLPALSSQALESLEKIEVQVVASREDARQFIGFKHINGPHKWDSFAKGKFAADWYRQEKDQGVTLRDIARRLGDRHDTILRLVQGIYVLEQAQQEGLFDLEDRHGEKPFFFSHLYTALTRAGYRHYLGLLEKWRETEPASNPVAKAYLPQLRQVLNWLYGSQQDDLPPVVTSQNPHIKQLGEVLQNEVAIRRLEVERSLPMAYAEVMTPARKFTEAMIKALQAAEQAQQNIYDFDTSDQSLLNISERLAKIANSIHQQVQRSVSGSGGED